MEELKNKGFSIQQAGVPDERSKYTHMSVIENHNQLSKKNHIHKYEIFARYQKLKLGVPHLC